MKVKLLMKVGQVDEVVRIQSRFEHLITNLILIRLLYNSILVLIIAFLVFYL